MEVLLQACLDEISFDGAEGCKLSRLWKLVEGRIQTDPALAAFKLAAHTAYVAHLAASASALDAPVPTPTDIAHFKYELDDHMRQYLWTQLLYLADILCNESASAKHESSNNNGMITCNKADLAQLSLNDAIEKYGDRLHLIASDHVIRLALFASSSVKLTDLCTQFLAAILKARTKGMTQLELSYKFKKDPRTTFHYLKMIFKTGLVVKMPTIYDGRRTQLCFHVRFAAGSDVYKSYLKNSNTGDGTIEEDDDENATTERSLILSNVTTKERILSMLSANNGIVTISDVIAKLNIKIEKRVTRKWFNRIVTEMQKANIIKRVIVVNDPTDDVPANHSSGKVVLHCLKLLSEVEPSTSSASRPAAKDEAITTNNALEISDTANQVQQIHHYGFRSDLTIERQVYDIILKSGSTGVSLVELSRQTNHTSARLLSRITQILCTGKNLDRPYIVKTGVQTGRLHVFKYFASEALDNVTGSDGMEIAAIAASSMRPTITNVDASNIDGGGNDQDAVEKPDSFNVNTSDMTAEKQKYRPVKTYELRLAPGEPIPDCGRCKMPANTVDADGNFVLIVRCTECGITIHGRCHKPRGVVVPPTSPWQCNIRCRNAFREKLKVKSIDDTDQLVRAEPVVKDYSARSRARKAALLAQKRKHEDDSDEYDDDGVDQDNKGDNKMVD
eukprot:jgi/Hompol1/469/HPOL_001749-RA